MREKELDTQPKREKIYEETVSLGGFFHSIEGLLEIPEGAHTVVVVCHGFTANKDQLLYRNLRNELIDAGFGVFRFNFSIKQLENDVQQFHVDSELAELGVVTSFLQNHKRLKHCSLAAVGHSYGATILALFAGRSKAYSCISLLAAKTWLATTEDDDWSEEARQKGYFTHTTSKGKKWRVHKEFIKRNNKYHEIMQKSLINIKTPTLVLIGSEDDQHNHTDSKFIQKTLRCKHKDVVIPNTDHAFKHPKHQQQKVGQVVADWVKENTG